MVASETDISLSFALAIGPTAAMALPPHIAVPEAIKYAETLGILSHFPIIIPINITLTTENKVNSIPSDPAFTESSIFMPKPSPTTETCSKYLEVILLNTGKGVPRVNAKTNPKNKAIGGDINGVKQNIAASI